MKNRLDADCEIGSFVADSSALTLLKPRVDSVGASHFTKKFVKLYLKDKLDLLHRFLSTKEHTIREYSSSSSLIIDSSCAILNYHLELFHLQLLFHCAT